MGQNNPPYIPSFGAGAPGAGVPTNTPYYDTTTVPYTGYVYRSGAWHSFTGSGGGGGGSGLWAGIMSAVPTMASTGFTTWANQGAATASDAPSGIAIAGPTEGFNAVLRGLYTPAPVAPYSITALVNNGTIEQPETYPALGWFDGVKADLIGFRTDDGSAYELTFTTTTNLNNKAALAYYSRLRLIWLQLVDDGTSVSANISSDGEFFKNIFTQLKATGFLGAGGYSNLFIGNDNYSDAGGWTLASWK